MRFGVFLPTYSKVNFDHVIKVALTAEKLGFDSVWAADHHINPDRHVVALGGEPGKPEALEAFVTLSAIAAMTKKVRLGTCVTPIPRSQTPMHLAKTVATLDIVSSGRVILGVGTGWYDKEFLTYGFSWDKYKVRYQKMWEGVEIIKKMWTETPANYDGKHYKVSDAILLPKPIQKPHPPIWFGGDSLNTLKAAATLGNGWIPFTLEPHIYREKLSIIEKLLRDVGREKTEIVPAYSTNAHIGTDYDEVWEKVGKNLVMFESKLTEKEVKNCCIIGGPEDCIRKIKEYEKAGAKYIVLQPIPFDSALNLLNTFSEKVMPHFKE